MIRRVLLSLLALSVCSGVYGYMDCVDTIEVSPSGCFSYTTCYIYDDNTGALTGFIRGPFQQC